MIDYILERSGFTGGTMDYLKEYRRWLECAPAFKAELEAMDEKTIEDAFYRDLEFGTAGLRGVLGAGTNRMNEYVVARASQGLANYVNASSPDNRTIAIGYDSRIKSDVFSNVAAEVFAASGIKVYLYPVLMPVPCVSFAVRYFHCAAGVMVTASHNPSKYNGYKVYGPDGCQITDDAANAILAVSIAAADASAKSLNKQRQRIFHSNSPTLNFMQKETTSCMFKIS